MLLVALPAEAGKVRFGKYFTGGTLRIDCVKTNEDGTPGDDEGGKLCPFRLSKGDTLTLSDASGRKLQTVAIPNLHSGFVYRRNAFTGEFREERE